MDRPGDAERRGRRDGLPGSQPGARRATRERRRGFAGLHPERGPAGRLSLPPGLRGGRRAAPGGPDRDPGAGVAAADRRAAGPPRTDRPAQRAGRSLDLLEAYGEAVGEGDADGLAEGEALGDGEAPGDGEALAVTVGDASGWGRLTGAGPLFRKMNAAGTMINPAMTVTTKVTAPHSFRISCPKSTMRDCTDQLPAGRPNRSWGEAARALPQRLPSFHPTKSSISRGPRIRPSGA